VLPDGWPLAVEQEAGGFWLWNRVLSHVLNLVTSRPVVKDKKGAPLSGAYRGRSACGQDQDNSSPGGCQVQVLYLPFPLAGPLMMR